MIDFVSSGLGSGPDNVAADASPPLLRHQQRALLAVLITIAVAAPAVTLGIVLREGVTSLVFVGISLSVLAWGLLLMFRFGRLQLVANLLIFGLILLSGIGVIGHGSVRSSAMLILMAAVVGAGTFLSRRGLLMAGASSIVMVGALNWMEVTGQLAPHPNLQAGWAVFIAQAAVLICMLLSVSYGQHHLAHAFRAQQRALRHAKEVEADLRQSEVRFRAMFESNPVASVVQSVRLQRLLDANAAFEALFGYKREELLVENQPNLWSNAHDDMKFQAMLKATRRVNGMRATALRKDGSTFDALVYAEIVPHGPDFLLMAMVLDITAEESSRRELEKSEERFSKAFNFSPLGMTITRLSDGRFMEVNPANERILGYSLKDFAGRTSIEAGVWLSEEDRINYIDALRRDGRLAGYETQMRNHEGQPVDVKVWAEIIELEGEKCALSFTMNVAEEKRREAVLKNIAEGVAPQTGEAFFLSLAEHLSNATDARGVIVGELTALTRMQSLALVMDGKLQSNTSVDLQHTTFARLLATDGVQAIDTSNRQILQSTPPFNDDDLRTMAGIVLRDPDGTAIGILAVVWSHANAATRDIQSLITIFGSRCNAELVRMLRDREINKLHETLEQRVQQRTEQLQYLNRELDAFAYTVSHDLKSPLRSIDGFMHLLHEELDGQLTPDQEEIMGRVDGSVARMHSLITDLLALARVSQGQLQRTETDLTDLAESVIRQEQHRDPERQIDVVIERGMRANCDLRMAHIVLENLIGNAWKYSRKQPNARIEVGMLNGTGSAQGDAATFYVKDNGAGFDMSRSDRLFKPFTRLHSPHEFEGSGIGLATVRRIIERHGGTIRAEAAPGKGACFEFSFGRQPTD